MTMINLTVGQERALHSIANSLESIAESLAAKSVAPVHEGEVCMDYEEWAGNLDFEQRKELMTFLWNHPKWHGTCVRADDGLL